MNRRNVLKSLSLSIGGVVAAPSLMQLLTSCEEGSSLNWSPLFLDKTQGFVVENLVAIILPSGKNIGALDVNVPQFIDLVLKDLMTQKEQHDFLKGAHIFNEKFKTLFKKTVLEGVKKDYLEILSLYFNIQKEKQQEILEFCNSDIDQVENKDLFYLYNFLIFVRHYTLFGFYNSKKVGTEILNYNPIPGSYEACINIDDAGNISSS